MASTPDRKWERNHSRQKPQSTDTMWEPKGLQNERSPGACDLVNKLSMRSTQFLNSMSQLDGTWQSEQCFGDLFKSTELHKTITLEELRNFLTTFSKEIKDKHDCLKARKDDSEGWFAAEIKLIHQILKEEVRTPHSPKVPDHLNHEFKDLESWLQTIHAKLYSMLDSPPNEVAMTGQSNIPVSRGSTKPALGPEKKDVLTTGGDKNLKDKVKELQTKNKTLQSDLTQAKAINDKRSKELEQAETKHKDTVADLEKKIRDLESRLDGETSVNSGLTKKTELLKQNLKEAEEKNKRLIIDINDLKSRYSALAGSKMSAENPDIANLSDPFRPTKLAEMFSNVYDDEWTDAFGALQKRGEEQAINTLMSILQTANKFCRREAESLKQELTRVILETLEGKRGTAQSKQTRQQSGGAQKDQIDQKVADIIRGSAQLPLLALQQKFQKESDVKKWKLSKPEEVYANKCVELCWLMAIQSPPVAIDENVHQFKKQRFEEQRFKAYTRKGQIIDYVVWPAIFIVGGGMLGKGVAQCK